MADHPLAHFAHGQSVPHRHRAGAHETFPSFFEKRALDRPSRRIGPVQHPNRLAMFGCGFEHIKQGRDERVYPASKILQIDQYDIESLHRLPGRTANFPIQAEHRNIVDRIHEILGLDHIVLLVAPQTVLRAKGRGQVDLLKRRQGIEAVHKIACHRRGVRQQCHAFSRQWPTQFRLFDQPVYSEFHDRFAASIFSL